MSIGRPLARPDGRDKVTGRALFTADHAPEGMLYGVLVGALPAAARILGFGVERALAERGVVRVITHGDMPRLKPAPTPPLSSRHVPMQGDEIRYQGEPVAVVVGETLEAAFRGAELVEVRYQPMPFVAETGGADVRGARPPKGEPPYAFGTPVVFETGDPDRELDRAAVRQETTYVQPSRQHNPMETSAVLARWDGDALTLFDSVQHGYAVQAALAALFGVDAAKVRVVSQHTGGAFGAKGFIWPHEIIAAAAARLCGRPVRIQLTRAQQYATVGYQARTVTKVTLGADARGRLGALCQESVNLTGVSDDFLELGNEAGRSMYAVPAIRTTYRVVPRNVNLGTPMRSPVEGVGLWPVESAMNELAHRVGVDPLDLRLLNYAEADPASGRPWSSKKLREAYEEGARLFGWRERPRSPVRDGRWLVGHGMATCSMGCFRNPWKARLTVRNDGSALVEAGCHDIGTGTWTVMKQIAADVLGLDDERVEVRLGDTRLPEAGPTYGSSSTMGAGGSLADAADKLRRKLARLAAVPLDAAELREGGLAVRGGAVQPFGDLLRRLGRSQVSAEGAWEPSGEETYAMRTFGAIFVEVGVDPELGLLRLRRAVGSYSAGRIVNPRTARSQMIGGIIWGFGKAAMEEVRPEPALGRWLAKDLSNVVLPVNADIPADITIHFVEEYDRHASPIGAKGIGELAPTGVDAAVADAVFQAIGRRIRELPITPEKLI